MGVTGLWNLIEDSATKVNVETLRGKTLAIDLSIWINQSIKGFRDKDGRALENAHLIGLFHRVCKLLFYNIRPIFVFDGECPILKSRTLAKRKEKMRAALAKSRNISLEVLERYLASQLNNESGTTTNAINAAKHKLRLSNKSLLSDIFLPPTQQVDIYQDLVYLDKKTQNRISNSDSESDTEHNDGAQQGPEDQHSYHIPDLQNLHDIDINSQQFKNLPAVTRYEILTEIRESFKGRKNPFPEMMPSEADTFSQFQMSKLLKKRNLQEEIDQLITELNDCSNDVSIELMRKSGRLFSNSFGKNLTSGRLASDESTRFLLLRTSSHNKPESTELIETDDSNPTTSDECISVEQQDMAQLALQNMAYNLPNSLAASEQAFNSDLSRIEHLSNVTTSLNKSFHSQRLSNHLNSNVKMLINSSLQTDTTTNKETNDQMESSMTCSISEHSSSDSEDFLEVSDDDNMTSDVDILSSVKTIKNKLTNEVMPSYQIDNQKESEEISRSNELPIKPTLQENLQPYNEYNTVNTPAISKQSNSSLSENVITDEGDLKVNDNFTVESICPSEKNLNSLSCVEDEEPSHELLSHELEVKNDKHSSTPSQMETSDREPIGDIAATAEQTLSQEKPISMEELKMQVNASYKVARQAATINQQIVDDCQQLLRIFGIPWVVAPSEAEAQCASLEELGLCEGTITDDSDIFLFGGQLVYRHFFTNCKVITQYRIADLQKYYGLSRNKLICLGMLCGTDYTLGIDGIGPVTGLELLSEFPGEGLQPLRSFAEWYRAKLDSPADRKPENAIRAKLLKFLVPDSFPNQTIYNAYQNANVDSSKEKFSWSSPQLSELRIFARDRFGWSVQKTDSILLPVLKQLNQKEVQTRIDNFFVSASKNVAISNKLKIKRSKRLNEAIRRSVQQSMKQQQQKPSLSGNKRRKVGRSKQTTKRTSAASTSSTNDCTQLILSEESSTESDH